MSQSFLPYESDSRVRPIEGVTGPTAATMPPKAPRRQARTIIVLLVVAMVAETVWAAHSWIVIHYVNQLDEGGAAARSARQTLADLHSWGHSIHLVTWGLRAATGVFVIDWMLCVRTNADAYRPGEFRRDRGWIIWGWVCPVVNLWYPYECMADAWAASDPKRSERLPVKATPPAALVSFWWASFVAAVGVYAVSNLVARTSSSAAMRQVGVEMETVSHVIALVAGSLLIAIIAKVTTFGRIHRRIYRAQMARAASSF